MVAEPEGASVIVVKNIGALVVAVGAELKCALVVV